MKLQPRHSGSSCRASVFFLLPGRASRAHSLPGPVRFQQLVQLLGAADGHGARFLAVVHVEDPSSTLAALRSVMVSMQQRSFVTFCNLSLKLEQDQPVRLGPGWQAKS